METQYLDKVVLKTKKSFPCEKTLSAFSKREKYYYTFCINAVKNGIFAIKNNKSPITVEELHCNKPSC